MLLSIGDRVVVPFTIACGHCYFCEHGMFAAELEGRLVLGVVNFPPRQIGSFMSEVLTLGVPDVNGAVVLVAPDVGVPLGGKLF